MEMYHFATKWLFEAPIEAVWQIVIDAENYPKWWPNVVKANVIGSPQVKIGQKVDFAVKGKLPYVLNYQTELTAFEEPTLMAVNSSGDLVGTGKWVLERQGQQTLATYYWDVGTAKKWMNFLAGFAFVKKLLADNHEFVMDAGYEGFKKRLVALAGKG